MMYRWIGKALITILLLVPVTSMYAQSLEARIDSSSIWLGESARLSLILDGSDEAIAPELSIDGIAVSPLGGSSQNSQSVTVINGRTTRDIHLKYVYGFDLVPQRPGLFTIPVLEITVGGIRLSTRPLSLEVKKPEAHDSFHLLLEPDRTQVYPGQNIHLDVTLLFSGNIRSLEIRMPELEKFTYYPIKPDGSMREMFEIQVNGRGIPFVRNDRTFRGRQYAGVTGRFVLKNLSTAIYDFSASVAGFETVTGTQRVRDFFGRMTEQDVFERTVIPVEGKTAIQIRPYPQEGRPGDFFGLAGDVTMKVLARPQTVRVGDPITLEITLENVDNPQVRFPGLSGLLGPEFRVPESRSPDIIEGSRKTIVQTIRTSSADTDTIPSFSIPWFNTLTGSYDRLVSPEIRLTVVETQTFGAEDLEGPDEPVRVRTEKRSDGLYYNYAGPHLLKKRDSAVTGFIRSPLTWIMLIIPVIAYISLFAFFTLFPEIQKKIERKRSLRHSFALLEKETLKEDPRRKITDFLRRYYGILHYSQMDTVFDLDMKEREELKTLTARDYSADTEDTADLRECLLAVLRRRIDEK